MSPRDPQWLDWAKRLQAMAQTGLTYTTDAYDRERYEELTRIAVAMLARGSDQDAAAVAQWFTGEAGHATPKVDVRTAAFRQDAEGVTEVLLVREQRDGLWTLPGGWADVGESAAEAARRETLEESGFDVRITRLLALYDNRRHAHPPNPWYIYKAIFEAELLKAKSIDANLTEAKSTKEWGDGGDGRETDAVGFFRGDALPPLSLGRTLPSQLRRLFDLHAMGPTQPPDFD